MKSDADSTVIPFRLRVGVTGHRDLSDEEALERRVDQALDRILEIASAVARTPVLLEAVSPLGEGADQLVARKVLERPGATLEVPLPMSADRYLEDFRSEDGRRQFRRLFDSASVKGVLREHADKGVAYREVGHYVSDTSDVLIALWDGLDARGTGGTGEIVKRARGRAIPRIEIRTNPPYEPTEWNLERLGDRIRENDQYNRAAPRRMSRAVDEQAGAWMSEAERAGLDATLVEPLVRWITPHFVRANMLANSHRAWFRWLGRALFLMAAAAVATVAAQISFAHERVGWVWVEVALMLAVLLVWYAIQRGVQRRWIAYRFLAERFRAGLCLALADADPSGQLGSPRHADSGVEWLAKALREVWRLCPPTDRTRLSVDALKRFIGAGWIGAQIDYYRSTGRRHERWHRELSLTILALFIVTLGAAIAHASGRFEESSVGDVVIFLAIALPAAATALSGLAAQRQHVRNIERFREMVDRLQPISEELGDAETFDEIRTLAFLADREMSLETSDWIDVMRFHEVELPV